MPELTFEFLTELATVLVGSKYHVTRLEGSGTYFRYINMRRQSDLFRTQLNGFVSEFFSSIDPAELYLSRMGVDPLHYHMVWFSGLHFDNAVTVVFIGRDHRRLRCIKHSPQHRLEFDDMILKVGNEWQTK